jgi:hypothetical protein
MNGHAQFARTILTRLAFTRGCFKNVSNARPHAGVATQIPCGLVSTSLPG